MKCPNIKVVFDRKKKFAKTGQGNVEVVINFDRLTHKYIIVGTATPSTWPTVKQSTAVLEKVKECNAILEGLEVLGKEVTIETFNEHYDKNNKVRKLNNPKNEFNGYDQNQDFINFMKDRLREEHIAPGTRKHKEIAMETLEQYGKIRKFSDLNPANIMGFDRFLRMDGTRTDYTINHNYHKKIHQYIRMLKMAEMIPHDPYAGLTIPHGKNKERKPLNEEELKVIMKLNLNGKLAKARDIFIFQAYTGLAFCDAMVFDWNTMVEKLGDLYYIDGTRIKTKGAFFTPILPPALEVLKRNDYKLPHICNQKCNDYLHIIQMMIGINKNMTTHVARHSFATLALAYGVPIMDLARMLGHKNLSTTQIYGKVLDSTIRDHSAEMVRKMEEKARQAEEASKQKRQSKKKTDKPAADKPSSDKDTDDTVAEAVAV